jgi:hypothetical protein
VTKVLSAAAVAHYNGATEGKEPLSRRSVLGEQGGVPIRITDALLGEHAVFYGLFDQIGILLSRECRLEELTTAVGLLEPSLASHARLEEELLFSALAPLLGNGGPLQVMRMEHDEIDRLLARFSRTADLPAARELLRSLDEIVRVHFAKEEQILFPTANQALDPALSVELGAQWAGRRNVRL